MKMHSQCKHRGAVIGAACSRRRNRRLFRPRLRNPEGEISAFCVGSGYRLYNPATGRWISRDPIGEKGELNLYGFTGNQCISNVDGDGRKLIVLPPVLQELQEMPSEPPGRGYAGQTFFAAFRPEVTVYRRPHESCCWRLFLRGHAQLAAWWISGALPSGKSYKEHEMDHVRLHALTIQRFVAEVEGFSGCYTRGKARCLRDLANGRLITYYLADNKALNLRLELDDYEGVSDGNVSEAEAHAAELRRVVNEQLEKCDAL